MAESAPEIMEVDNSLFKRIHTTIEIKDLHVKKLCALCIFANNKLLRLDSLFISEHSPFTFGRIETIKISNFHT